MKKINDLDHLEQSSSRNDDQIDETMEKLSLVVRHPEDRTITMKQHKINIIKQCLREK